ncbi:hypothetical protein A1O1_00458 [Capronia coronata CBS 617.96]|uniref:BRCT domain-containing protein n=1 Tax=Capronia coronata CBS 617.96 TaxID=1182541 RepID=W9YS50_9EURO|nr:uncharacterized protein A1O1_00458 [Capronia coronata CBS 617.96]EXJ95338.1 hypothetical protein A1O1_00458 [Capronia coronata CBS 617.96]
MAPLQPSSQLDLKSLPPIYILPTHLKPEELHEIEDKVFSLGGALTYDPKEARIFLGRITQKKRAAFDLRARGVWTEEAALPEVSPNTHSKGREDGDSGEDGPARKKRRVGVEHSERDRRMDARRGRRSLSSSLSSTASAVSTIDTRFPTPPAAPFWPDLSDHILIVKLSWLETCLSQQELVPYKPYIIYTAKVVPKPAGEASPRPLQDSVTYIKTTSDTGTQGSLAHKKRNVPTSILERAKADASNLPSSSGSYPSRRRYGDHSGDSTSPSTRKAHAPPKLHRTTTSEFEELAAHPLPPLPEWAKGPYAAYSCCRSTPMNSPNSAFIGQLTKIRDARILTLDDIGVRAYSTSIASIAAYPHPIRHPEEVNRLPGCNEKIAMLWSEWYHSGEEDSERSIQTVRDLDNDVDLQHLQLFWNIWGVGAETARKFYFEHGWQDLNDVIEFGWSTLTRVQQIGVKYYDEFLDKIPRAEVEHIGQVIHRHARSVLDINPAQYGTPDDVECVIVGGYRRGKQASGDVDVVLSHRDESKTQDLVGYVVRSLELEGWITHTLTLHTTTSDRGQATLPFHAERRGRGGFDSLDKALCVWQDPHFEVPDRKQGDDPDPDPDKVKVKNPNIHRRVDIIISSWRTVGCAILGWSGGNTFQRDLRRFVANTRGWKFDSSGVRDRATGQVLDLEGPRRRGHDSTKTETGKKGNAGHDDTKGAGFTERHNTKTTDAPSRTTEQEHNDGDAAADDEMDDADTWQDRERRLMDGLGFGYRPPEERCTG